VAIASNLRQSRVLIGVGVTTVLVGIALASSGDPDKGAVVTLASLLLLIYALHRFGRSGPDAPEID
jgi:hypothetical protein